MKRFFINLVCILMLLSSAAMAKNITLAALEPVSSLEPAQTYKFQIVNECKLHKNLVFEEGSTIVGEVLKVKPPKHWKKDAYIVFKPTQYIMNDNVIDLTSYNIRAKITRYEPIDIMGNTAFLVLNTVEFLVPGIFEICSFVNGYQKAEENKVKAGFIKIYKDSPLAYPEKGDEIDAKKWDYLLLKVKIKK